MSAPDPGKDPGSPSPSQAVTFAGVAAMLLISAAAVVVAVLAVGSAPAGQVQTLTILAWAAGVGGVLAAASLGTAMARRERDRTELREQSAQMQARNEELLRAATRDDLTGLSNRTHFLQVIDQRLRSRGSVAVVVMDLDDFHRVNDTHGHVVGDEVLRAVAGRVSGALGSADHLARIGGDKLAALLRGVRSELQAELTARSIAEALRQPILLGDTALSVTASIGVAVPSERATSAQDLLRDADIAVARAKRGRGTTVAVFDDRDREAVLERHRLEGDLRHAVRRRELELHLQPLVAAENLAPLGFEALVRWRHPERGLVPPGAFIPLAEETGLILEIGTWVLEEGCRILRRLHDDAGSTEPYLSVNVSARQLMAPTLPMTVASAISGAAVPASRLVLEVTETVMMDDVDTGLATLEDLAAMGVGIALDDFGTGYSSMSYLSRIPATHLKVDRSFVRRVRAGTADRRIVGAVIGLAHSLGLSVVAEGVETEVECDTLNRLGADVLQGYHLAKPLPVDEALAWRREQLERVAQHTGSVSPALSPALRGQHSVVVTPGHASMPRLV